MNQMQSELWKKLESFNINDGTETFTFEMRLSRENRWSMEYTQRVMEEYRKFLFLCGAAGHPCSPSQHVDEAWHLHLTYTRSYWEKLCGTVLPKPLHHEPTKGGSSESLKFDDWYERTLASYRTYFGSEPPLDIWPPTQLRFEPEPSLVNSDERLLTKTRQKRVFVVLATSMALSISAVGCDSQSEVGITALLVVVGIILFAIGISAALNYDSDPKRKRGDGSGGIDAGGCGSSGDSGGHHGGGHHGGGDHGGGHDGGGHGCSSGHGCGSSCGSGCGGGCGGGGD